MFYQFTPQSRFLLGTAGYPSPDILHQAIDASGAEIITVSLRREGSEGGAFRTLLQQRAEGAAFTAFPAQTDGNNLRAGGVDRLMQNVR